jgi:hypothetical protein
MSHPQPQHTSPPFAERRRFPRFPVREKLLAELIEVDRPARVRDISFGGFATETREPLAVGTSVTVRFTSADDRSATVTAEPLHSWPSCDDAGAPCYVTGFAFADTAPKQIIQQLIDTVTTPGLYK